MAKELVGGLIPSLAECLSRKHAGSAHIEQQLACNLREMRGELCVVHCGAHLSGMIWRTIYSAASVAVISTVLTRISGLSGGS